jgi:hypothetical protein
MGLPCPLKENYRMKNKKECLICGNEKKEELEITTLFSDGDGNEAVEKHFVCKEGKGCST